MPTYHTYLPTCQPAYLLHTYLVASLPAHLPTCLQAYLPICLPTYLPAYLPTCLHSYLPTCLLTTCLPANLPTYLSAYYHVKNRLLHPIEMSIHKTEWLIMAAYNPRKENRSYFLSYVSKGLDKFLADYEHFLMLGDFNSQMSETHMKDFCELYDLEHFIKGPTCYKNPNNPSSIDVMLTNKKKSVSTKNVH